MSTPTIVYVTHHLPSHEGHGGNHRAYQLMRDIELAVGKDHVHLVKAPLWWQSHPAQPQPTNHFLRLGNKLKRRLLSYTENPFKVLSLTSFATKGIIHPKFEAYYKSIIEQVKRPALCVIEHPCFTSLMKINQLNGIPTICCPQNIEAFSENLYLYTHHLQAFGAGASNLKNTLGMYAVSQDFVNELYAYSQCAARLFISRVETGLIGGLGLPSQYYPYLPVGELRQNLKRIRERRVREGIDRGLFLLLGSATHTPTGKSFARFIAQMQEHGLPPGVRVVVVGAGTDKLLPPGKSIAGLELKGWLVQKELDELMLRARAVLVPQQLGFGTFTRLIEAACAGMPVIASSHSTYAINSAPGLDAASDCWQDWYEKMEHLSRIDNGLDESAYDAWEEQQPKPLSTVVDNLIKNLAA